MKHLCKLVQLSLIASLAVACAAKPLPATVVVTTPPDLSLPAGLTLGGYSSENPRWEVFLFSDGYLIINDNAGQYQRINEDTIRYTISPSHHGQISFSPSNGKIRAVIEQTTGVGTTHDTVWMTKVTSDTSTNVEQDLIGRWATSSLGVVYQFQADHVYTIETIVAWGDHVSCRPGQRWRLYHSDNKT